MTNHVGESTHGTPSRSRVARPRTEILAKIAAAEEGEIQRLLREVTA